LPVDTLFETRVEALRAALSYVEQNAADNTKNKTARKKKGATEGKAALSGV
jgi:hypothetical protein